MSISTVGSRNMDQTMRQIDSVIRQATGTSGAPEADGPRAMKEEFNSLNSMNPGQFKEVTANIAKQLNALSAQQSGDAAQMLKDLAGKFDQASKTGSIDSLKPPDRGPPTGSQGGMSDAQARNFKDSMDDTLFKALQGSGADASSK
jgi:hypothetical protein